MAEASTFRGVIEFFDKIGIYDVVLPFLLVFTIVFAILEKTRIFGMEKIKGEEYTRKNLNAMTAFVAAFFVIASSRLVEIVTEVSANAVVLLMASVLFLMLVGSFYQEKKEGFFLEGPVKSAFIVIMFVGLAGIFLHAIKTAEGKTWLEIAIAWIRSFWTNEAVASIILIIIVVSLMYYITKSPGSAEKKG
jgi:hypothetical protein